ncbi:restriction endonuclease, partial [Clostridioides difficile]
GTENELNAHYKRINEEYPVVVGQDFWYRLTGDENFYFDLIDTIAQSALEEDCTVLLKKTISNLADEISKDKSLFNQK